MFQVRFVFLIMQGKSPYLKLTESSSFIVQFFKQYWLMYSAFCYKMLLVHIYSVTWLSVHLATLEDKNKMPPRRAITPPLLEELCLMEVMNYLERELIFCSQVRRFQHNSLLLRRRGINADSLVAELRGHLDGLPPLLSEMVRQRMTNKYVFAFV